jgi:AcrR family transcriptional regulator
MASSPPKVPRDHRRDVRRRRGPEQRERIVLAAAELFGESGYTATGMTEIGAAVGITGGALYRHFPSKGDVLGAVVARAVDEIMPAVEHIVATHDDPDERLRALVENLADACIRNRPLLNVLFNERRHLDAASQRLVDRTHRLHVAEWLHALSQLRPELSEATMVTLVHQVWGASLWGVEYHGGVSAEDLRRLLVDGGVALLLGTTQP